MQSRHNSRITKNDGPMLNFERSYDLIGWLQRVCSFAHHWALTTLSSLATRKLDLEHFSLFFGGVFYFIFFYLFPSVNLALIHSSILFSSGHPIGLTYECVVVICVIDWLPAYTPASMTSADSRKKKEKGSTASLFAFSVCVRACVCWHRFHVIADRWLWIDTCKMSGKTTNKEWAEEEPPTIKGI